MLTFVNIVRQWRDLKTRSFYAQQPEYTLPRLPEVHWKLYKYKYLHITDTQRRSQQRPLQRGSTVYADVVSMYCVVVQEKNFMIEHFTVAE